MPFILGSLLAYYLYPRVADGKMPFTGFVLFMGAAMSVTAFPVLARILSERGLVGTRLGTLTITCAAVDDVTAWCILAAILSIVRAKLNQLALWEMLAGLAAYLGIMLFVLRPIVRSFAARHEGEGVSDRVLAALLLCMLASSWATEWLGMHALFGAFFAGVMMPKEKSFAEDVRKKLRPLVVVLLLPLFFAFTGTANQYRLSSAGDDALLCLDIYVAVAGKFGGSMIAARVMENALA